MNNIKNILTAVFIVGIFALHPSLNKGESPITYLHYFVYGNDFNISYNGSIEKDKVIVKWACESIDADCKELIIYQEGKKINEIPFEKGSQSLLVYYGNRLVGKLNQEKTTKIQSHQYNIKLKTNADLIVFDGEIIGPAATKVSESISITDLILAKQ